MRQIQVLLLDDESVICDLIRREIEKREDLQAEYVIIESGTGKEALQVLEALDKAPDLLFVDLRLNNGVTGFDVIDRALEKFPRDKMNITILTGCWEGSDDWERATRYQSEGKVNHLIGKWGIGIVLKKLRLVLEEAAGEV